MRQRRAITEVDLFHGRSGAWAKSPIPAHKNRLVDMVHHRARRPARGLIHAAKGQTQFGRIGHAFLQHQRHAIGGDNIKADAGHDRDAGLTGGTIERHAPHEDIRLSGDVDRKSTRLNSSHANESRMPSSA